MIIDELLYISIDYGMSTDEYSAGTHGNETIKYDNIM